MSKLWMNPDLFYRVPSDLESQGNEELRGILLVVREK